MSVGVGRTFETVCLSVCLSVCPQHSPKTNDPKVFKLGVGNNLGYSLQVVRFWVETKRSKVKVELRVRVNSYTAWVRTL